METIPDYVTSPEAALQHALSVEDALLKAGDAALAELLERVTASTLSGNITRANVVADWKELFGARLAHPVFVDVRGPMLEAFEESTFDDDIYSAAQMALEIAHNMGATPAERTELIEGLFAHPKPSLLASLSERVDAWLRKRISRLLLKRIGELSPNDLRRSDLVGREFEIPIEPHAKSSVKETDWSEDDRPGQINWRARMQRDIRTAYTGIFGRQMQRQLDKYGFRQKRWISRRDDRVRHTHRIANGQVSKLYEHFTVGGFPLMFPGDPEGPPQETINCRCVLIGYGRRY